MNKATNKGKRLACFYSGDFHMASYQIFTTADNAAMTAKDNERTIVARFKNPARAIAVNIPNDAWEQMHNAVQNPTYRALLDGVLESAAKGIISAYYLNTWETNKVTISTIPDSVINAEAILEQAAGNNSDWMTKDELAEAWKESATRARIYDAGKYAASQAYRRAFTRFEEMILKLAGKTSFYKPEELDAILAKLSEEDFETEFGRFVVRRVRALQDKPTASDVDLSVL